MCGVRMAVHSQLHPVALQWRDEPNASMRLTWAVKCWTMRSREEKWSSWVARASLTSSALAPSHVSRVTISRRPWQCAMGARQSGDPASRAIGSGERRAPQVAVRPSAVCGCAAEKQHMLSTWECPAAPRVHGLEDATRQLQGAGQHKGTHLTGSCSAVAGGVPVLTHIPQQAELGSV